MKSRWSAIALTLVLCLASSLSAEERYLEFISGLRDQDLHDMVLLYLDRVEAQPRLDAEIKTVIPFERGLTLLEMAEREADPAKVSKMSEDARLFFEQFLKASPDHPNAARASAEVASVLVVKGRAEVIQSRLPANEGKKAEFQVRGRALFTEAQKVFQAANDKYKQIYESFDPFIDKDKEKAKHLAREAALMNWIQQQINLAQSQYYLAQTYNDPSPDRSKLLTDAANSYELIHQRYRSYIGGLYARLYQAKCFQEMGEDKRAMGILDEILEHGQQEGTKPPAYLIRLQNHALHFRLISLLTRKDYQVAIDDAETWLKSHPDRDKRTSAGLGILYQLGEANLNLAKAIKSGTAAVAAQKAADKETAQSKEKKKKEGDDVEIDINADLIPKISPESLLRKGIQHFTYVSRFAGEYREISRVRIKECETLLGQDGGDPKTFAAASSRAKDLAVEIKAKKDAWLAANGPQKAAALKDFEDHLKETVRICNLSLALYPSDPTATKRDLVQARWFQAYAYYSSPSGLYSYDAAVTGDFTARHYKDEAPTQALEAAYLAMVAYQQSYNRRAEKDRDFDMQKMRSMADFITTNFPGQDKAYEAVNVVGQSFLRTKQAKLAAEEFLKIPESAPQYEMAQLSAGQSLWQAYLDELALEESKRRPKEELDTWPTEARKILEGIIAKADAKLAADAPSSDSVTLGKLTLIQILNFQGDYKGSLKLLTEGPKSVFIGVAAPDKTEAKRPEQGPRSASVASFAHREALRAFVGNQQVDKAREELKALETIGGQGEGLTRILVDLGRQLQKEVEDLRRSKNPRLADVLKTFEDFLGDLFNRKDGRDYTSLLWIAQTYFSLGEGVEPDDKQRAQGYFGRAGEAYQAILDAGAADPKFIPENGRPGIQLRLVMAKRRQKEFETAYKLVTEILAERSKALDVQEEAAHVYQDWGARGGPDDWKYFNKAILGDPAPKKDEAKLLWGWHELGERLSRYLMSDSVPPASRAEFESQYLTVRYNLATCRLQYALAQNKGADKERFLNQALQDVELTAATTSDLGGEATWKKFNELYQKVQTERNNYLTENSRLSEIKPVKDLEKTLAVPEPVVADVADKPKKAAKKKKEAVNPPVDSGSGAMTYAILGLGLVGVLGAGAYFLFGKKKPKVVAPPLTASITIPDAIPDAAPVLPAKKRTKSTDAPRTSSKPKEPKPS